ncbi:MAG: 4-(cytidine 5'-diphospho)-2-C-methyl-D-erythritol kinase [Clostridia bacterium]|nr:4-(cytidine 5'-diphospho)-2-C-methyl-D-erythritol kinase [Clostridia bacterium]
MNYVKVKAYAKLNLTLEIVGRSGGFHLLDSLVTSVDLFDLVKVKKRKGKFSSVVMHGMGSEEIPPEQNNALKAAERFSQKFGVDGVEITVFKNIPLGGGLGGSSADAAGVLSAMQTLFGIQDDEGVAAIADELGSDVRYMLKGGFARMCGRGERIEPIEEIKDKLWFLLLCPKEGVSAGAAYRKYDELNASDFSLGNTTRAINALKSGDTAGLGGAFKNDLYPAAAALQPTVKEAVESAESFSPLGAGMTGSGSCAFALFETKELCEWAKSRYKGKAQAYVVSSVTPKRWKKQEKSRWGSPFALTREEIEKAGE